jgi:hypothetical protein
LSVCWTKAGSPFSPSCFCIWLGGRSSPKRILPRLRPRRDTVALRGRNTYDRFPKVGTKMRGQTVTFRYRTQIFTLTEGDVTFQSPYLCSGTPTPLPVILSDLTSIGCKCKSTRCRLCARRSARQNPLNPFSTWNLITLEGVEPDVQGLVWPGRRERRLVWWCLSNA